MTLGLLFRNEPDSEWRTLTCATCIVIIIVFIEVCLLVLLSHGNKRNFLSKYLGTEKPKRTLMEIIHRDETEKLKKREEIVLIREAEVAKVKKVTKEKEVAKENEVVKEKAELARLLENLKRSQEGSGGLLVESKKPQREPK